MNFFNIQFNDLNNKESDIMEHIASFKNIQTELNSMLDILSLSVKNFHNPDMDINISYSKTINNIAEFKHYIYTISQEYWNLLFSFNDKKILYRLHFNDFFFVDNISLKLQEMQLFNQYLNDLQDNITLNTLYQKFEEFKEITNKISVLETKYNQRDTREKFKFIQTYLQHLFKPCDSLENYPEDQYIYINMLAYIEGKEITFRKKMNSDYKYLFIPLKTPNIQDIIQNCLSIEYIQQQIIELNPEFFNLIHYKYFKVIEFNEIYNIISFEFKPIHIDIIYDILHSKSILDGF